jgi:hypothetical protein
VSVGLRRSRIRKLTSFSCLSRRSSSSAWPAGSDSAQKNWAQISRSNGNLLPPFVFLHKHFWFSWLFLFAFLSSFCIYYAPDVSSDHLVELFPSSSISRGASDINSSICMSMFPLPHCASFISTLIFFYNRVSTLQSCSQWVCDGTY